MAPLTRHHLIGDCSLRGHLVPYETTPYETSPYETSPYWWLFLKRPPRPLWDNPLRDITLRDLTLLVTVPYEATSSLMRQPLTRHHLIGDCSLRGHLVRYETIPYETSPYETSPYWWLFLTRPPRPLGDNPLWDHAYEIWSYLSIPSPQEETH